jgi:hypothetical protein
MDRILISVAIECTPELELWAKKQAVVEKIDWTRNGQRLYLRLKLKRKHTQNSSLENAVSEVTKFIASHSRKFAFIRRRDPNAKFYVDMGTLFKKNYASKTLTFESSYLSILSKHNFSLSVSTYASGEIS